MEKSNTGTPNEFSTAEEFLPRHIGPSAQEQSEMLKVLGFSSLDHLTDAAVPEGIQLKSALNIQPIGGEVESLKYLREEVLKPNQIFKNYIGMGYYGCHTPAVIQRNILENPGWYTAYTPYQAEIAQGRLEALVNFQTMIADLTGMQIANASLLDEGTAAAEAMSLAFHSLDDEQRRVLLVADDVHPQTIDVLRTRAIPLNLTVKLVPPADMPFSEDVFACVTQYPGTDGKIVSPEDTIKKAHAAGALAIVATDLLALTLLKSPGEMGADLVVGNSQRFGVPFGFGGPHAGFFATKDEFKRQIPGRLVGVSVDMDKQRAYRLALQTREQHIRREKATSNICTAQVLLAVMASMYAVYHGPEGLKKIARRTHYMTQLLAQGLKSLGFEILFKEYFDTIAVQTGDSTAAVLKTAQAASINLRPLSKSTVSVSFDETVTLQDVQALIQVFAKAKGINPSTSQLPTTATSIPSQLARTSKFLEHPVFNTFHSETEMLRYMKSLESKDLALNHSMIPLGSCTMKLNATAEMLPVTWPEVNSLHPFAPASQTQGYLRMTEQLESWLSEITGFDGVSLQPNAGSQGEYAGLLVIRGYHISRGEGHRHICLIPTSAHGTNPASAVMAGMKVVPVRCDEKGNVDVQDLKAKTTEHGSNLAALMVTYPSTHGVFEASIREICEVVHAHGGQVYLDGANMNAQIGLCRPGDFGADVCHLNLHKTFCIPHGGGGPGVGPIGVKKHLIPFLPGSATGGFGPATSVGSISAAPYGSASILPISWMYIAMMGGKGLKLSAQNAILNANYIAKRLSSKFQILFSGDKGLVAHECIIDLRPLQDSAGITAEDVAKRLMDYSFHAPTMSWPVAGTIMIEPTESESKAELDRFCEALLSIHAEAEKIASGAWDRKINPLKLAPHTESQVISDKWDRGYSREVAAFPLTWVRERKFWPKVARIDNAHGDRNLFCACPPWEGSQN